MREKVSRFSKHLLKTGEMLEASFVSNNAQSRGHVRHVKPGDSHPNI